MMMIMMVHWMRMTQMIVMPMFAAMMIVIVVMTVHLEPMIVPMMA